MATAKRRTTARRKAAQRKSRSKYTIMARRKRGLSGIGEGYSNTFKFIVLVIITFGIYFGWTKWKEAQEAKKAAGNAGAGIATQLPPAQLPPASTPATTIKDVANAYFQTNPFAYAATSGGSLNIRSLPSDTARVIASVANNAYIGRHTGRSYDVDGTASTRWAKVTLADGRTGWVFSRWIKSEPKQRATMSIAPKPATNAVAKPAAPATALKIALFGNTPISDAGLKNSKQTLLSTNYGFSELADTRLPKGLQTKIIQRSAPWALVETDGQRRWIWDVAIDASGKIVKDGGIPGYKTMPTRVAQGQAVTLTGMTNPAAHRSQFGRFYQAVVGTKALYLQDNLLSGGKSLKGVDEETAVTILA